MLIGVVLVGGTALGCGRWPGSPTPHPPTRSSCARPAQYDGTPSSVFEARLDQAHKLYEQGVAATIVTVGGKQEGDEYTEAASGRNYLMDQACRVARSSRSKRGPTPC